MRVVMMGTGPFAVPTLEALYGSRHDVLALFTRPPRVLHGKSRAEANPMRELAVAHQTPVHEPESINAAEALDQLTSYHSDLLVVCDYGQILSAAALATARLGGINLHASLLPKYRGAAPIHWAIYHGEQESGVTIIHMTPRLDAGPAIVQLSTPIGPAETAAELEPRLAALGAPAVLTAIDLLEAGTARPIEQNQQLATRAPRLTKELGRIDWSRSAVQIVDQIRAFQPWPKSYMFLHRASGEPLRLIVEQAIPADADNGGQPPGTILAAAGDQLWVACGMQALAIQRLQPAGKRVLSTAEFLRGYPIRPGERFDG